VLIIADAKMLELVAAFYLSKDKVGRQELSDGIDLHASNQATFGLPTRLVAKTFAFRAIYCDETSGGAYGFSLDPDFADVSRSARWWQQRIDEFFTKYKGLASWHGELLRSVGETGRLIMPYGREYSFFQEIKGGEKIWPKSKIYNYPVQGLGAELMAIVRVSLLKRIQKAQLTSLLVSTVHDSVLIDAPEKEVDKVCEIVYSVFRDVPRNFEKIFSIPFDMSLNVEIKTGPTWGNMELYNADPSN